MHPAIKKLLQTLLTARYIGAKHTPEDKLIKKLTRHLTDKRRFHYEYKRIEQVLIRVKKRTKKSNDWHISLDPKKLKEVYEMIKDDRHI